MMCAYRTLLCATLLLASASPAWADDDACAHFKWDVSHERALMQQPPRALVAATQPGPALPALVPDQLYRVELAPQAKVTFAATPGKALPADGAAAGLARVHIDRAGHYRVAQGSAHWIDVLQGGQMLKSVDFNGVHGCERPHKVVEFDLAAGDAVLQFSGAAPTSVLVSVTPMAAAPAAAKP